jgi:hypothetical protein
MWNPAVHEVFRSYIKHNAIFHTILFGCLRVLAKLSPVIDVFA